MLNNAKEIYLCRLCSLHCVPLVYCECSTLDKGDDTLTNIMELYLKVYHGINVKKDLHCVVLRPTYRPVGSYKKTCQVGLLRKLNSILAPDVQNEPDM